MDCAEPITVPPNGPQLVNRCLRQRSVHVSFMFKTVDGVVPRRLLVGQSLDDEVPVVEKPQGHTSSHRPIRSGGASAGR